MSQWVHFSRDGHLGRITFDRPKANAYVPEFMSEFVAAIGQANDAAQARVIVIGSASAKFFCAGADIFEFSRLSDQEKQDLVDNARTATALMEDSDKVYIAAINGHALGGGLEIAMACDLRIGSDGPYYLGLPEVKLGLMPGNGGTQRLGRLVGMGKALEIALDGNHVAPNEAVRIGLLNRLYPAAEFEARVEAYVRDLSSRAPLALASIKQAVRRGYSLTIEAGLEIEAEFFDTLKTTPDAIEGFQAFLEKREPRFNGDA